MVITSTCVPTDFSATILPALNPILGEPGNIKWCPILI